MASARKPARQALLAALLVLALPAQADMSAAFSPETGAVVLSGLSDRQRAELTGEPWRLHLRVEGAASSRGMAIRLSDEGESLVIDPRFPLRPGTAYVVGIELPDAELSARLDVPAADATPPALIAFAPSQAVIPANTLRLYLNFSQPMARGRLLENVALMRSDGSLVESPFLNLETELWDASQTRATLLLDPGRIKQGVGPNSAAGAPLEPGGAYRLVIGGRIESAAGIPLGTDVTIAFRAGPPERRAISTAGWHMSVPEAGSLTPFAVSFDRIMDSGAVLRLLRLESPSGGKVDGAITTDGGGWSLSPAQPWQAGEYRLIVAPDLEDVSGNTVAAPFDADPGTMGRADAAQVLSLRIAEAR